MAYGVDPVNGFNVKRLRDIQLSLQSYLQQVTDPESGESLQIDFNEDDPFIQIINSFIDDMSGAWDQLQIAYNQFNPNLASGASLSGLVQLNSINRKLGTASSVSLLLEGTPGLIIPTGQTVTDLNNTVNWVTRDQVTLDGSGQATVTAYSEENGAFIVSAGEVNKIVTPVTGWTSVENTTQSTLGTVNETDEELRVRRRQSTLAPSQAISETIYSNILNLEAVEYCRVYVNNTNSTDSNGIPKKSFAVVVVGGNDDDIAEQIFVRQALGVESFGDTVVNIVDLMGFTNAIKFIRPTQIIIDVEVTVQVVDDNVWTTDSPEQMKENIVLYAKDGASGLGIDSGFEEYGFTPGADVIRTNLYTPVNSVPGHKILSVKIAEQGDSLAEADVSIDWNQIAYFDVANITVAEV